jgi:hypothetical protein
MPPVTRAALAYFAIVFTAGFALGVMRVLVSEPAVGRMLATLIELPFILAVSWIVCAWLVAQFRVAPVTLDRLAMGAIAFVVLIVAETCLGVFGFGRSFSEHLRVYSEPGPVLGLMGQIAFALLPWVQMRVGRPGLI